MKKLIFVFIIVLSFTINMSTNATWYGTHQETVPSGVTWCAQDGDTTGGLPPLPGGVWNGAPLANYTYDSRVIGWVGGNKNCQYWDASNPTGGSVTYLNGWTNTAQTISFGNFSDAGGAKLYTIVLQQREANVLNNDGTLGAFGAWVQVKQIGPDIDTNWRGLDTYVRTFVNRKAYQYQAIAYDEAWNPVTVVGAGTIKMENEPPTADTPTITTTPPGATGGWTNRTIQTIQYGLHDTGGSRIQNYVLEMNTSTNNPSHTVWNGRATAPGWVMGAVPQTNINATYTYTGVNGRAYKFRTKVISDYAGNTSAYSADSPVVKIDTTQPVPGNVSSSIANNANLLATNSQNFVYTAVVNGGSPITHLEGYFENWNTVNGYLPGPIVNVFTNNLLAGSTLSITPSIQNVDNNRVDPNGGRQYSFQLTRLCDEAGNCAGDTLTQSPYSVTHVNYTTASPILTYNYNVFANTTALGVTAVTSANLTPTVADGLEKNAVATLKDTYGNNIVPATGISRTIDFNFSTTNTLYLNQYSRTGNAVFADIPSENNNFTQRYANGALNTSFNSQPSTDGTYNFGYKFFTPTSNQTIGKVSDTQASFAINSINFDANGSLGAVTNQAISNSNIFTTLNPAFSTAISGEIHDFGLMEGTIQSSAVTLSQVSARPASDFNTQRVFLEFGTGTQQSFNAYAYLQYGTGPTLGKNAYVPIVAAFNDANFYLNSIAPATTSLYTKLIQVTALNGLQNTYVSTHIKYQLDGNIVLYNSDITGKSSYWSASGTGNTSQKGIKVLGTVSSQKTGEIELGQFSGDVAIFGNISKSKMKADIVSGVNSYIKSVSVNNGTAPYNVNVANFATSGDGQRLANDTVVYFNNLTGANVTVSGAVGAGQKKTVVVIGGNIYINANITAPNDAILGLIALKDASGNGGNIYIDPSVGRIHATMFAEKAIISFNVTELDGNTQQSVLKNQLYIYGSIFSENTVGGARTSPTQCPYFENLCPQELAQKYDLNYLRRYYIFNGIPANGGLTINTTYREYPVVVEYNPRLGITPPPLFSK